MFGMKTLFAILAAATGGMAFGSAKTVRANRRASARRSEHEIGYLFNNVSEDVQLARVLKAEAKRARKEQKLDTWAFLSADNNRAHVDEFDNLHDRLNPFYVAK